MGKSVNAALLDQMMGTDEASQRKKERKKGEIENLKRELARFDKYEKELKKRGVSKDEAMKNMEWGDSYIDPKKIADTRKKAEKLGLYKSKKRKKPVEGLLEKQGY